MGQTSKNVEHKHNPFIKQVNCVDLNMTQTCLATTYDLFINGLAMLGSQFVSDFIIPNLKYLLKSLDLKSKHFKSINLKSKSESKFPNATFDYFPTSHIVPRKNPLHFNCLLQLPTQPKIPLCLRSVARLPDCVIYGIQPAL